METTAFDRFARDMTHSSLHNDLAAHDAMMPGSLHDFPQPMDDGFGHWLVPSNPWKALESSPFASLFRTHYEQYSSTDISSPRVSEGSTMSYEHESGDFGAISYREPANKYSDKKRCLSIDSDASDETTLLDCS